MLKTPNSRMPLRRTKDVTIQHVGDETLLYDERLHRAFCLNRTTALVWRHCDGTRTPAALADLLNPAADSITSESLISLALSKLAEDHLIEGYADDELPVMSRRSMLVKGGAGLAFLLPAIAMITAPKAAQAYSGCFNCSSTSVREQRRRALAVEQQRKAKEENVPGRGDN